MWPFTRKRKPEDKRPSFARPALRSTAAPCPTDANSSIFTNPSWWTNGPSGSSGAESGYIPSHHDCNTSAHASHSVDMGSCGSSHDGGWSGGGFDGGGHSH
jgi:hypothetical protein